MMWILTGSYLNTYTKEWEERTIYGKRIRISGASKCSKRLLGL
jgi:hypothetical protein